MRWHNPLKLFQHNTTNLLFLLDEEDEEDTAFWGTASVASNHSTEMYWKYLCLKLRTVMTKQNGVFSIQFTDLSVCLLFENKPEWKSLFSTLALTAQSLWPLQMESQRWPKMVKQSASQEILITHKIS